MENRHLRAFAAYSPDEEMRLGSSSGGVFTVMAEYILSVGGSVYGVSMSHDSRSAKHIRVTLNSDLKKLRGSKYTQAYIGNIYKLVKIDLDNEKFVLFTGTACQINGLKGFLGKKYTNLYLVDVVCHGVPSPALWNRYVSYIEDQQNAELVNVKFRCKDKSWYGFEMEKTTKIKTIFISKDEDPFMTMFLRDYSLRPSCYKCLVKSKKQSDISIADFWGIDYVAPNINDEKGTSLIIIRSEKGEKIFSKIKKNLIIKLVSYKDGVRYNPAEYMSVSKPPEREFFFKDMNCLSFDEFKEKYTKPLPISTKQRFKKTLKVAMKKFFNSGTNTVSWSNYGMLYEMRNKL